MANFDDLLRRVARDPALRDQVRTDPTTALEGHDLSTEQLRQLDQAVRVSTPGLGGSGGEAAAGTARAGVLTTARLAVAGVGIVALGAGAFLGGTGRIADPRPERLVSRDPVDLRGCPSAEEASIVGQAHRGDRVYAVARTRDGGWIAIRDLDDLEGPAVWLPAANLDADASTADLPIRRCATDLDGQTSSSDQTTTTVQPAGSASTTSTGPGATTSSTEPGAATTALPGETTLPPVTLPGGQPAPMTPGQTPTTQRPVPPDTRLPTPTTAAPDTRGPTVSVTPDRPFLYTDGSTEQQCASRTTVDVTVTASDPSGATLGPLRWSHPGRTAGTRSGTATPLGGGRYRLGPLFEQVPISGTTTVTLSTTATDGRGNTSTGTTAVQLRAHGDTCIG